MSIRNVTAAPGEMGEPADPAPDEYRSFAAEILSQLYLVGKEGMYLPELEARVWKVAGLRTSLDVEADVAALIFEGLVDTSDDQRKLWLTDRGRLFVSACRPATESNNGSA